jgi:hypothetical protein
MKEEKTKDFGQYFYRASAADFIQIPGGPIAYWLSPRFLELFASAERLSDIASPCAGLQTSDNNRFLRLWHEVSQDKLILKCSGREESKRSGGKWFPCTKGGSYRRWYGNNDFVVNWENDGEELYEFAGELYGSATRIIKNASRYFEAGLTWSSIAPVFSMRYAPEGFIFETKGSMCFPERSSDMMPLLALTNSKVIEQALSIFSPTLDFHEGPLGKVPISYGNSKELSGIIASRAVTLSSLDWDSFETSWDFSNLPLLSNKFRTLEIKEAYRQLCTQWQDMVLEMRQLEEENNKIFIQAYGLQDELEPNVALEEISLTCNPIYRYGAYRSEKELETLAQCDTIEELVSYIIGCIMGRYSLDEPGLILARQTDTILDFYSRIPAPSFAPDDDAILPLTNQEWFSDDATNQVQEFVRVVWGDEHLKQNLDFIAESLCLHAIKPKRGESALDTVRRYLSTQFFKDHLRTYRKRPIYWLFSSGKHKAFECLVYLHRCNEGTLARMRTEYVIPLSAKLNAYAEKLDQDIEASTSAAETKRLEKEVASLHKQQGELAEFDEKLRHYADQRIKLNLDDGVKANYGKFGDLLAEVKAVTGESPQ